MGAIFGVLGAASDAELEAMGRAIAHRGKTIRWQRHADDLAAGAIGTDPGSCMLASEDVVVVCDAAIYNADDILAHLRASGSRSDNTPAGIFHALFRREGPEGLERINGDFAVALIDRRRGEVVFGRDYVGARPLYYTVLPSGGVAFASEYKALLRLAAVRPETDREMVQHLQCAKALPVGRTLLANVAEVLPTGTTRLDRAGTVRACSVFTPLAVEARASDEAEAVELVRHALTEAVRRRSQRLDRIGLALSGGIDSIGIAFLLRELNPDKPIHTFTAGSGPDDPEIIAAQRVAGAIGSIHHQVITGPDLVPECMRPLAWHLEDPVGRSEALQLYCIGRAARDHVDALFTGDSADGLFAGMPRHVVLRLMERVPLRRPLREFYDLTQLGRPPTSLLGRGLGWAYRRGRMPPPPRVLGARMPGPSMLPRVQPEFVNVCCAEGFPRLGERRGYKYDRAFGAWGVEALSPFHDVPLARTAFTITDRLKLRGRTNKYVLRRALATIVPGTYLRVPKFPQRMRYDLAFTRALEGMATSVLSDEAVRRRGLFEAEDIRRLRRRPRADRPYAAEAAMRLWTAILTECWARQFVDRCERPEPRPDGGAVTSRVAAEPAVEVAVQAAAGSP